MKTNFRFPSGTGCSGRLLHGALHTLAAALLLFAGSACENEDPDVYTPPAPEPLAPLTLVPNMDPRVQNDIEIEEETTGVYRIHTTGEDPYFCTVPFDGNVPADLNVLAFEYQTDRRTDHIQLFFWTEVDGEVIPDVERTIVTTPFEAADTWKEYSVRIRKCREEFFWGEAGNLLRIDFGTVKDADIRLRNLRLREMTDAERAEDAAENENDQNASVYEERLKEYLHASYTSKVDRVEATADKIRITGSYAGEGSFLLYELPPYADITRIETAYQKYATPLTQSPFDVTLDRMASPEGFPYDRLLSQWAVVCRTAEGDRIVSHGRYADEVAALRNLPPVPMRSKKGLGGFYAGDYTSDLDDLGITSATVNVSPLQFMYLSPAKAGMVEHAYCGETYYFDTEKLDALDATLRETAARDITVAAILLVDPAAEARDAELGALLQHPDYTRGTYTMPNMTTPKAVRAYAAMIDFLAQRYCREDDAYGRIAHWIVHNEVDGGVDWTNMGDDKLVTTYTNAYVKSMRLCASIVRQYDANAEFFASFSHSWSRASNPGWYPVRDMVGLLGDFSRAEGDFRWALACHSYPETISDPCTWREPNATFAMNTPFVTLKNLEVLSKWALTPRPTSSAARRAARYGSPKREPTPPPTPKPICATSVRASPTAGRKSPPCPASTASSGTTGSTTATRGRCASACAAIPTTPKTPAARNRSGRPTATRAPTARRRPSRLSSPSSASPTGTFCNPSQTETDEKRHRGARDCSNAPMPFPARRTDYRSAAAVSATGYSHRQDRWRRTRC